MQHSRLHSGGARLKRPGRAILAVIVPLGICPAADATYVHNDPANGTDPTGEYQYTCETGSRIGCAQGFQTSQENATIKLQNAIEKLGSAIDDAKAVSAAHAAGNISATVSSATGRTEGEFAHAFGQQANIVESMSSVREGLQSALSGLQGNGPATNATGQDLAILQQAQAPAGAVPNSHALLMNPAQWNSITYGQRVWTLIHEPLHGEAGWRDYRGPNGIKYYRWESGGHSPLELNGPAALSNPDNAVCFIVGGC